MRGLEIRLNTLVTISLLRRHLTVESGGGKKFGEMPAINRHKNLHCAYRLAHANFDKRKLRGSRKGLQQGVEKFLFSTRWLIKTETNNCKVNEESCSLTL